MKAPNLLQPANSAFVWIWLPNATAPVVCGRLDRVGDIHRFTYGKSYLARPDAIAIWQAELPLTDQVLVPDAPHLIAGTLRDAAPDQWGRRVVMNRQFHRRGQDVDLGEVDELNYLLLSGSNRIGALDFQVSPTAYVPRQAQQARLADLLHAADAVERGTPLPPELDEALRHGTSIGGARPKAQLDDEDRQLIAKFSSTRDTHNVVKAEYLAMKLAHAVGLHVATVELAYVEGKDILLVERFDRIKSDHGFQRKAMISALTLLSLDENAARYASYWEIADRIRRYGANPSTDNKELWSRMLFNILVGNTDDHARNHGFFWDGSHLHLTPAYDIDPRPRLGREANHAMALIGNDRRSLISTALEAASHFGINDKEAQAAAKRQITIIQSQYRRLAQQAGLTDGEANALSGSAFLNPYIFEGAPAHITALNQVP